MLLAGRDGPISPIVARPATSGQSRSGSILPCVFVIAGLAKPG